MFGTLLKFFNVEMRSLMFVKQKLTRHCWCAERNFKEIKLFTFQVDLPLRQSNTIPTSTNVTKASMQIHGFMIMNPRKNSSTLRNSSHSLNLLSSHINFFPSRIRELFIALFYVSSKLLHPHIPCEKLINFHKFSKATWFWISTHALLRC